MKLFHAPTLAALILGAPQLASAATATFNLDYVATNAVANITANPAYDGHLSANTAFSSIGTIIVQDLADIGVAGLGFGGVRITVSTPFLDDVFKVPGGTGNVWARSVELNFPYTLGINGYDSLANLGNGNNWANVSGLPLTNGVEWQERGTTDSWNSTAPDGEGGFSQELNWTGGIFNANSFVDGSVSTFDLYSNALVSLSVASLLGDSNSDGFADGLVRNTAPGVGSSLPPAWAWIRLNGSAPLGSGILASGFWGNSANAQLRVNVLATSYSVAPAPVPVPAAFWLLGSSLMMGSATLRRRPNA